MCKVLFQQFGISLCSFTYTADDNAIGQCVFLLVTDKGIVHYIIKVRLYARHIAVKKLIGGCLYGNAIDVQTVIHFVCF